MKRDKFKSKKFNNLRKEAEKVLSRKTEDIQKMQMDDYHKLLNDLEVHQVELEMQNEELRYAHEKLLESRERYVDLYDFAPIGYLTIDQNGQILEVNLTCARMLGVDRHYLIKSSFFHFVAKESQDVFYFHRKRIFEKGRKETCELHLVKKDRTSFYAQLQSIAFKDSDGNFTQFRTTLIDITERRNIEEELKKRTNDIILRNKELNCLYNISNIVDKSGISLEEIIQRIVDLIPSSWQYSEIACSRIILEGREWRTKNFRETIWKQMSDIIIHGKWIGVLEVFYTEERPEANEGPFLKEERILLDIIAERFGRIIKHKKAEKALRDSEAKFKALSENSPNMIFINRNDRIVYVNKKCEEITGYKNEEFYSPSFNFLTLHPPEFKNIIKTNFAKLLKGEEISQFESTILNKTGKRIEAILSTKLIVFGGEKAILCIVTDISKLKTAEQILKRDKETFERLVNEKTEELLRSQEKLQNAKQLSEIGILAATVAHELRNPLAVIMTASSNIRRKSRNPSLDKHLDNIEKHVSESNQIINNLLYYSRIKKPQYEKVNIYDILDECIFFEKESYRTKDLLINKNIKSLKDIYIEADPLQIKEMFVNILNNAYDALSENGGENERRIEIAGSYNGGDFVKVHFRDNGSGISEEDLKRVSEPFFSTKSKGTGLGLAVCHQIVDLHEGKIEIESKRGKGTTITVSLPIKRKK